MDTIHAMLINIFFVFYLIFENIPDSFFQSQIQFHRYSIAAIATKATLGIIATLNTISCVLYEYCE